MTNKSKIGRKLNKGEITKIILKVLAGTGFMAVAILAPNALQVLSQFGLIGKKHRKHSVNQAIERLLHRGLLATVLKDGCRVFELTKKGEAELSKIELDDFVIEKPRKWDKKWRVIIFDISEKRRRKRDAVREKLRKIGFYRLQDSVWVYPYDCEDLVTLLKTDLEVGKDLLYLVVDRIENDQYLMEYFEI